MNKSNPSAKRALIPHISGLQKRIEDAASKAASAHGISSRDTHVQGTQIQAATEQDITCVLKEAGTTLQINSQTWPEFASSTRARLHAGWEGQYMALFFSVDEPHIRSVNRRDQAPVYQDSCVEFFAAPTAPDAPTAPAGQFHYYNFEFNALGYMLAAVGPDRFKRQDTPETVRRSILRFPSLAADPSLASPPTVPAVVPAAENSNRLLHWELTVALPISAFFLDTFTSFAALHLHANFYKCGDLLPSPHYQSWSPVHTARPDFHRPEFFGSLSFGPPGAAPSA